MARILVVEDETTILENIIETLELEHYKVMGAPNGRVGVEVALREHPDLILCDIAMPELDGYGVLLELRGHAATALTPLIFLTAHADRASMRQGFELGADDYLTKPFSHDELLRAVKTQLEKLEIARRQRENELDMLRDTIIAALPHELRTPLSGIIGCADFLILDHESIDRDQMKNIAEIIMRSGNRLQRVLENYLVYSQITAFASDPQRIAKLREEVCDYTGPLLMDAVVSLAQTAERPDDLTQAIEDIPVAMSPDNLSRIGYELVDNAFKFSNKGTPVEVTAQADGDHYWLRVSDQGRGMTANQISRIGAYNQFNRSFYEQQGLGLGLVIAKRTTEIYGGTFTIESQPDVGTTVTVKLPLVQQPVKE